MALVKQSVPINFSQGLDLKTDPLQISIGKFLSLENSVFDKGGRLTKRNGFASLSALPTEATLATTFNGGLTAVGSTLQSYSSSADTWVNKGSLQLCQLGTKSLVRSSTNQSQADAVVASNGLVCTVYTDNIPSGGSNVAVYKYVIEDSVTGQNIVVPTLIPAQGGGTVTGSPRVFVLDNYFIIVYTNVITATSHLDYMAISISNPTMSVLGEITSAYVAQTRLSWDAVVYSGYLFVGYNSTTGGQNITFRTLSSNLIVSGPKTFVGAANICTIMSMCVDASDSNNPVIWAAFYNLPTTTLKVIALSFSLGTVLAPTTVLSSGTLLNLAPTAQNGSISIFYELQNVYTYDSSIATNVIGVVPVTQAGSVGSQSNIIRSLGLASKAVIINGISYMMGIYSSTYQPSYFLINGSGTIIAKFAYSNGGSYYTVGLPSLTVTGSEIQGAYFIKDLLQSINKNTSTTLPTAGGVYSQTGINLVSITLGSQNVSASEIGQNLNISGGFVTAFDGVVATEQEFFVWPDYVETTVHTTGGSMADHQYYYQVTYEWSDNQGNLFRSAPSIPVGANVSGGGGSGSVTINIPNLRLTYKTANPVSIVIYRWSTAQPVYYQVTSISVPIQNSTTADSTTYVDTLNDTSIIGNNIIYTNGGVLENISPPPATVTTLFNNRLWLVDAEDQNLLWYSKQVIENTPVEMSDLLTVYIAPTTGAQGSTGTVTAMAPMDDKLVIWKQTAMGYINGNGPDNTGANNGYSDFILINSVVGCENQQSIILTPVGLMFQSNKGIWLLGRDLSTQYIGAPVETLVVGSTVLNALVVPGTTQVRFALDSGITLMYDYYFQQWATFKGIYPVTGTIFENLHTYFDSSGRVFQETIGSYLDGSNPVVMSFTTGWITMNALQGYQRAYQMNLLGTYSSPHFLVIGVAYDYNSNATSQAMISPTNFSGTYGQDSPYGQQLMYGGVTQLEQWRIFFSQQRCQSIQISCSEIYDPKYGAAAGQGLSISGINFVIGAKNNHRPYTAAHSVGAS